MENTFQEKLDRLKHFVVFEKWNIKECVFVLNNSFESKIKYFQRNKKGYSFLKEHGFIL